MVMGFYLFFTERAKFAPPLQSIIMFLQQFFKSKNQILKNFFFKSKGGKLFMSLSQPTCCKKTTSLKVLKVSA